MDNEVPKNMTDFFVLAAQQVSDSPADLYSIEVVGTAAGANSVILYDGFGTADQAKVYFTVSQNVSMQFAWRHPKRFSKGIYLHVATGTPYVSGQFETNQ